MGRFAPSPSGSLHLGSLYIAVASYLHARSHNGNWLVRIEDIDGPRTVPGAAEAILRTLSIHGLHSDLPVLFQQQHLAHYKHFFKQLQHTKTIYPCICTRAQIKAQHTFYQQTCRYTLQPTLDNDTMPYAWRFRLPNIVAPIYTQADEDFIIKRKDGLFAYNFVVVLDDIAQNVTHIVRGNDLVDTTSQQNALYEYFKHPRPQYLHLPVLVSEPGQKLSKQNHAPAIDNTVPTENLLRVFHLLGINTQGLEPQLSVDALLAHGIAQWPSRTVTKKHEIIVS